MNRTVTFAKSLALVGVLAVVLSIIAGNVSVYASICQLSAITPNYPLTADATTLIEITVPIYMTCSTNYNYSYMNVEVQLVAPGASQPLSSGNAVRAYPGISNFTVTVAAQTPPTPGTWNVNVVVTVVQANYNTPTDSITTIPISIQIQQSGSY